MAVIGLIQLDILWENVAGNIAKVQGLVDDQATTKFDLLVLPELWSCGFTMNEEAHRGFERGLAFMIALSKQRCCAVLGGLPHKTVTGQENRCYLVEGDRYHHYTKIKAFKFAGEHLKYEQGHQTCCWPLAGFHMSPFICYDLRFPELSRAMVPQSDLLVYVANWPKVRVHHWRQLLIARAIENLCYVVAVNRVGRDGTGLDYPGCSMVIDPAGEVLLEAGEREALLTLCIEPGLVAETRRRWPFLNDK